jgi:putative transposase
MLPCRTGRGSHRNRIAHRWRYGYRRVTAELLARGMLANHKRVLRIMLDDNLLTVHRDWLRPADSDQSLRAARIYLNLPNRMALSGPNQLWLAAASAGGHW